MKKRTKILLVLLILILIIPIPTGVYRDGGTRTYTALTYKIVDWNHFYNECEVYDETKVYPFPLNFMSVNSLLDREEKKFKSGSSDVSADITANEVIGVDDLSVGAVKLNDFAVRLFKASVTDGTNTLVSPVSVLSALSMTANGAEGETLSQMESVLGMTADELNPYLYSYMKALPQGDKYKLSLANSIWFTDDTRFTVNRDFLQLNADYYGADIFTAPFDDTTCDAINNWVDIKTDGMIPEILDEIPDNAVMYLVNALAFDAEWENVYKTHQVRDGEFIRGDGKKQSVEFMYGEEDMYLESDNATGFIKPYKDGKYAFVALLPNEDISLDDYISGLDGSELHELVITPQQATVYTSIPKFKTGYSIKMNDVLEKIGMPDAFDKVKADFTSLGTSDAGNIFINRVLHKTFISVNEKGTQAGASTVVEMADEAAPVDVRRVNLTRPFVYMLIECETNTPFFIGAMTDIHK